MQKKIFTIKGKLIFDPENLTKKHEKQSSWKKTAIVFFKNCDICNYYSWFINKRYGIELLRTIRGPHFTVINDKIENIEAYNNAKQIYDGKIISITYSVDPKTDDEHWWLCAYSKDAENVRIVSNLNSDPYFGFHITIGRTDKELRLEQSKYIHELIKKYGKEYY